MRYVSTRGTSKPLLFTETVTCGMADDGGLFLPDRIPDATDKLGVWKRLSYTELAFEIMRMFCDIPDEILRDLIPPAAVVRPRSEFAEIYDRGYRVFRNLYWRNKGNFRALNGGR